MTYSEFREKIEDNKEKLVYGACVVLVFLIGFGIGKTNPGPKSRQNTINSNYTKNNQKMQMPAKDEPKIGPVSTETPKVLSAQTKVGDCLIKGNISASGSKIYHVSGGAFYKRVKPEQCFATAAEAEAAGFRKSSR